MTLIENKNDWTPVRLDEVLVKREENDRESARSRFDTFVKVEHMEAERLHLLGVGSQKDEELPPTFYKIFRKGQILFPTRNPHLRRTALAPCDGICGEKTLTLEVKDEVANPNLIPFLFHSASFYDHTAGAIIGSTNPHCRWRDVADYEFLLPPKDQQAKLAELLWAADSAVESGLAVARQADTARKAFIATYFSEKAERYVRLQDAADVRYGLTLNSKRNTLPNRRPYLRVANVGRETIDLSEVKEVGCSDADIETFRLELNDVLIVEGHANIREIGRSAIWKGSTDEMLHQNHLIRARCNNGLAPKFLSAYINSPHGQGYFQGMAKSTSGLNTINSTVVKDFKVPVIPEEEQSDFVTKLDELESSQSLAAKNHLGLRMVLKSLINQIF